MPVRLGIVGANDDALRRSKALLENDAVRLVALCDTDFARAQSVAKRLNATAFKDAKRLLENETVDALYIAAAPAARRSAEIEAIARGCGVLLEMPLATHRKGMTELLRAAREHRALVCPALPLRYSKLVLALQKCLKARGAQPVMISVVAWGTAQTLQCSSTHIVDTLRFLGGEVRSVTTSGRKWENGCAWTLQFANGLLTTLCFAPCEMGDGFEITVQTRGARHQLNLENRDDIWYQKLTTFLPDDETREWSHIENPALEMNRAFLAAVISGRRAALQSTLPDAARSWAVVDAAQRAMKTGKAVRVAE